MASAYNNELVYLMNFYGISKMPIYDINDSRGEVSLKDNKLVYNHTRCFTYYTNDEFAFRVARLQLNEVAEAYKRFSENAEEVSFVASYKDSDSEYNREETWSGNLNDVLDRLYKENHRLTYCNGCSWKFKDMAIQHLYLLWLNWLDYTNQSLSHYMNNGGDMW